MEIGKAREIIRGIHDDDVEVEDKVTALQEELNSGDVGMCEMVEVRKAVGKWEVPDERRRI